MNYFFILSIVVYSIVFFAFIKGCFWMHRYFHRKLLKEIEKKEERIYLDLERLDLYELRIIPNWDSKAKTYTYQIVVMNTVVYLATFDEHYVAVLMKQDGDNWTPIRWYESMFETGGFKPNDKLAVTFRILLLCKIIRSNGKESGNVG